MKKYYILFMKKTIMKVTSVKNNCIVRIKIMNEIQCIKIIRIIVVLLYICLGMLRVK